MFAGAENITLEDAICTIVGGEQFNAETRTEQVKPKYVDPSSVEDHALTGFSVPLYMQSLWSIQLVITPNP